MRLVGLVREAEQEGRCALSVLRESRAGGAVRLVGLEVEAGLKMKPAYVAVYERDSRV